MRRCTAKFPASDEYCEEKCTSAACKELDGTLDEGLCRCKIDVAAEEAKAAAKRFDRCPHPLWVIGAREDGTCSGYGK